MIFDRLEQLPPDGILGIAASYAADTSPDKIDASVGVYRNEQGVTPVMRAVAKAERELIEQQSTKVYLPVAGSPGFRQSIFELAAGSAAAQLRDRSTSVQAPGGCGALRLAAEVIRKARPDSTLWIGDPTWGNHIPLLSASGLRIQRFPYADAKARRADPEAIVASLGAAQAGDVVLLQASCHNPTGADLDGPGWLHLLDLLARRDLVPFFDLAYQGLGDGLDLDAEWFRVAAMRMPETLLALSCSKNFGLYRERVGALIVVTGSAAAAAATESHVNRFARSMYSMSPAHGALLVERVLASSTLRAEWTAEVTEMRERVLSLRTGLAAAVQKIRPELDMGWLARQRGMFSLLGISAAQVADLRTRHHVYMPSDGRVNIAGLKTSQIEPLARAIAPYLS